MKIDSFDTDQRVLIIAEIGNNHEGSYALAEELIGLAAGAGADAVKLQTIVPERLVAPEQADRLRQLERFRLSWQDFERLAAVARREGVLFLSTPFDRESARFLEPLVPAYKIASGDNNFFPLLEEVARTGKPLIVSTGLADLAEIRQTRDFVRGVWAVWGVWREGREGREGRERLRDAEDLEDRLALLHCVSSYPTPPAEANLLRLRELARLVPTVGYSDHTLGIDAAVLAVGVGARILEKHFTVAKDHSEFRDHQLSADPPELARLVERVREAERLLGDGNAGPRPCEVAGRTGARRSIVARRDLPAGAILSWDDLDWLRPGGGLPPGREVELLGLPLARPVTRGERLRCEDVVRSVAIGTGGLAWARSESSM